MIIPKDIQDLISALRNENTRGATELVQQASVILERTAQIRSTSLNDSTSRLIAVSKALVNAQRSMAPILNLVNDALSVVQHSHTADELSMAVRRQCRQFTSRVRRSSEQVAQHASQLIRDGATVMTHSRSSAVFRTLRSAHETGRSFEVLCTESRPLNEGVDLARDLAALGLKVTLITDASVFSFVRRCTVILVGADAVSLHGVVNKMGTAMIGEAARSASVPFYVLASTEKFLPSTIPLSVQGLKNPGEILDTMIPNISPVNIYFDVTPSDHCTGCVTEEGILSQDELKKRLAEWRISEILDLETCG